MAKFDVVGRWDDEVEGSVQTAAARIREGDLAGGRKAVLEALAGLGLDVAGSRDIDADALSASPPHWLIVYGQDRGRLILAATIPVAEIPEPMLTPLRQWGGSFATAFGETCYDAPEQWVAWARFTLAVGVHEPEAFALDLKTRLDEGLGSPTAEDLASWHEAWKDRVAACNLREADASRFDVRIVDVSLIRETQ